MALQTNFEPISRAQERFAKHLYETWPNTSGNVFFSPYTIHSLLTLLYKGTQGNMKEAFARILHLPDTEKSTETYESLSKYVTDFDINFHNETKLYIKNNFKLAPTAESISKAFKLDVQNIPDDDEAISAINNTFSPADSTIELLNKSDGLVLINTARFKSIWACKFDPRKDDDNENGLCTFIIDKDNSIQLPMMSKLAVFKYKTDEHLEARIVEVPFANEKLSMLIILPDDKYGIDKLEAELTDFDIEELTDHLSPSFIDLALPKIKIELTTNLNQTIKTMGLSGIFEEDKCNLSGLFEGSKTPVVSKIIHRVSFEADESGKPSPPPSESSAGGCYCQVIEDAVTVNHPFVMYLLVYHQNETPSILMQARIVNPVA